MFLEICVENIESALAAERGGADRIELCSHLSAGGLTPSFGLLSQCKKRIKIPVRVMLRPRAGNFYYSSDEYEVMKEDLLIVKKMGFEGIVFGILNEQFQPDLLRIKDVVSLASPMKVTFHRAFDFCPDPLHAIDLLVSCGIDSLLTSGQQNTAIEGHQLITALQVRAGKHIRIIAGSGLNDENIISLAKKTGLKYFHMSARKKQSAGINNPVHIQSLNEDGYVQYLADENLVRKIKSMPL